MARSPFSIFRRPSKDRATGKPVVRYCARFLDEDGNVVKTKTLESTSAGKAHIEAKILLDAGEGRIDANPLVLDFLADFWRPGSDYASEKARTGHPLSILYVEISACIIRKHLGALSGVRLRSLNESKMVKIIKELSAGGTSPRTINALIQAVRVPVTHWSRQHRIPDPLMYLQKSKETPKLRGTLTVDEISRIAALTGESPRIRCAVLLGGLCGLRLGEIRGLEWSDIHEEEGYIDVQHNYVDAREGSKAPKCGSARKVPLPVVVWNALELVRATQHEDTLYVIGDFAGKKPIDKKMLEVGFYAMLYKIGVDEDERKERNLVFHGLRHSFVTNSRAEGMKDIVIQAIAGHRSATMMDRYTHAENLIDFTTARLALLEAKKVAV